MKKTGFVKTLGRDVRNVIPYYNRTGKRDQDGKPIFERLTVLDFTK